MNFATINAGHRAYVSDTMRQQRLWARDNTAKLQAEWDALPDVPRTIEQHLKGIDHV